MAEEFSVKDLIRREAIAAGVPVPFALAVAEQESSFNPSAIGDPIPSQGGIRAIGTFQLLPATAARYKKDPNDPLQNIQAGTLYLKELFDRHQGDHDKILREYGGVRYDTQYVPGVLGRLPKFLAEEQQQGQPGALQQGAPPAPPPSLAGRREPGGVFGMESNVPPDIAAQLDAVRAQKAGTAPPGRDILLENVERARGVAGGIVKGAGQTATNLGAYVHKIPGVTRGVDALYGEPGLSTKSFAAANEGLKPISPEEQIGKVGEQLAELFYSGRAVSGSAKWLSTKAAPYVGRTLAALPKIAVEAVGGAGQSAAQGGDPVTGGEVSGAMSVLGSTAGAAGAWLRKTAGKKVEQALGATAQRYKAIARRLVPQVLQRGIWGSHETLINDAAQALDETDVLLDEVYAKSGGQLVNPQPVINALERSKDAFRTTVPHPQLPGMTVMHEFEKRPIEQLQKLQEIIYDYNGNLTLDQLVALRKTWDNVVSLAGGFEHRAGGAIGLPLAEQTEAWAKREGAGAIRELLRDEFPDLAALNKEWSFWKGLKDVVTQTAQRTGPQGPGLGSILASGAGRVAGAAGAAGAGATPLAALSVGWGVGQALKVTGAIVRSPRWRLASAQVRNQLAQALMEENPSALLRIAAQFGVIDQTREEQNVALPPPPPETGGRGAPPPPPPRR